MHRSMRLGGQSLLMVGALLIPGACKNEIKVDVEGLVDRLCEQRKEKYGPSAKVTFSKYPGVEDASDWQLAFHGLQVQIPKGEYQVKPSKSQKEGEVSVLLDSPDQRVLLIKSPPLEVTKDVFAKAGGQPNPAGVEMTKEAFGGKSPTAHDLAVRGYQHTPKDLRCDGKSLKEDSVLMMVLDLKKISPFSGAYQVYHNAFGLGELTYAGEAKGGWKKVEVQVSSEKASWIVTYLSKEKKVPLSKGLVGACKAGCKTVGPPWLLKLGDSLRPIE